MAITNKTVKELGAALVELNLHYDANDYRKILDYALVNRKMLGYPHEIAEMLEAFAKELRKFPDNRDPMAERWKSEAKGKLPKH